MSLRRVSMVLLGILTVATQAIRLLGCDMNLTGISATVAATMTQLGINLAGATTARTPQEALEHA
jgi:anti-anti-sigma regulatory factor